MTKLFSLTCWRRLAQGGFFALALQLLASGSAWAACNVELYSTLANGQDRLKATCDTGISITSITWYKDGAAIAGSTSDFAGGPNPGGSIFYALPLAVGCADTLAHTYTAKGNNGAVPSGAGATIACSANLKNVTLTVGANGTATCPSTVVSGNQAVCTINPDATYTPQVGGTCPAGSLSGSTYTSGAITQDCNIAVTFNAPNANPGPWTVSTTTTGSGSLTCPSPVNNNGYTNCTATGQVQSYTGTTCPGSATAFGFNAGPITQNCTVQANFSSGQGQSYAVTGAASPSAGGTVTCNSPVTSGNATSCAISTTSGYTLTGVSGCGGTWGGGTNFTTGAITSACTVTATFSGPTGGGGGSASCNTAAGEVFGANDYLNPMSLGTLFPVGGPAVATGNLGSAVLFNANSQEFPNGLKMVMLDEASGGIKEAVISRCPHNFDPVDGNQFCRQTNIDFTWTFFVRFGPQVFRAECAVPDNGQYYLNFRDANTPKGRVTTKFQNYMR